MRDLKKNSDYPVEFIAKPRSFWSKLLPWVNHQVNSNIEKLTNSAQSLMDIKDYT